MSDEVKKVDENAKVKNENGGKKKKVWLVILIIAIILVLVCAGIGGYFVIKHKNENNEKDEPIESSWANTYYAYIKEVKDKQVDNSNSNGVERNIIKDDQNNRIMKKIENNSEIKFIDVNEIEDPVMVVEYKDNDKTYSDIYYIQNNLVYCKIDNEPTTMKYFYNMIADDYDWYSYSEQNDKTNYTRVESIINPKQGEGLTEEQTGKYTINNTEKIETTDINGNNISIPKADTIFVDTGVEVNEIQYNDNIDDKQLKNEIRAESNQYKSNEDLTNDTVKNAVENKVNEVKEKQTQIENAKAEVEQKKIEDQKKAEEEAKKKAEEEAKKKAEEEANSSFKVGKYTAKYGKYVCKIDLVDASTSTEQTIEGYYTFNPDGTCVYEDYKTKEKSTGTFTVGDVQMGQDISTIEYVPGVRISTPKMSTSFAIGGNNSFHDTDIMVLKYVGK